MVRLRVLLTAGPGKVRRDRVRERDPLAASRPTPVGASMIACCPSVHLGLLHGAPETTAEGIIDLISDWGLRAPQ